MKRALAVLFLTGLLKPATACAGEITCPETVTSTQRLDAPKPWRVSRDPTPIRLRGVALYDGQPEMLGRLKPDNGDSDDDFNLWTFPAHSNDLWIECLYDGTQLTLTQRLPKGTRSCRVTYGDKRGSGYEIKKIVCE